jgi:hypothetical protein
MKKIFLRIVSALIIISLVVGAFFAFNIYERKKIVDAYEVPPVPSSIDEQYDVIVLAGEPEGVAAAISAARNGAKTLLIEEKEELGGLFTYGMLNFIDYPKGSEGDTVTTGIYQEWRKLIGNDVAFGIEEGKAMFYKLVSEEENLTLLPQTKVTEAIVEDNTVTALTIKNKNGEQTITANTFIDASQDADFAVMAGAPYFLGAADIGNPDRKMAVTLMIHLHDVDWLGVFKAVREKTFGYARMNLTAAWGFDDLHKAYTPVNPNTRLRGLNLVKDGDDYYINALQIFGIDGLDDASKAEAIEIGKAETEHIVAYLRESFPGFENAKIASYPTELYVRETRHIEAEYQVTMADVWTNRNHDDYIAYGAYPVDVQAQTPLDYGYVLSAPAHYGIPFRSIIPQKIDGLLVVNRSAGYSSLAAGSARIVPTGMGVAEAAGVAAVLAQKENKTFRELSTSTEFAKKVREQLKEQGAFVKKLEADYPYKGEWYDEAVQTLINKGLVVGGYENDIRVEEDLTYLSFMNTFIGAIERTIDSANKVNKETIMAFYGQIYSQPEAPITMDDVIFILATAFEVENNLASIVEKGILKQSTINQIRVDAQTFKRKEAVAIIADVINYVEQK